MRYLNAIVKHGLGRAFAVTRLRLGSGAEGPVAEPQTLLVDATSFQEIILDTDGNGRIAFGPLTQLGPVHAAGQTHPFNRCAAALQGTWDVFSSSIILVTPHSILLLAGDNSLHLLAGDPDESVRRDGNGTTARFEYVAHITTDGAGCLYVADSNRIRKVRLPPSFQGRWHSTATAGDIAAALPDITVTTLPFRAVYLIRAVFYQPGPDGSSSSSSSSSSSTSGGTLVFASNTALYRVALPDDTDSDQGALATQPELLAGADDELGDEDGPGPSARFWYISGLVTDSRGCIYVADDVKNDDSVKIRKVVPPVGGGPANVVTLVDTTGIEGPITCAILPCGYLAIAGASKLDLIYLKLQPVPLTASDVSAAAAAADTAAPPPRTLPGDLGALLDRQPDDTADVTLVVGDRSFAAHRAILAARSEYFRGRLTGGAFVDSRQKELSLPEADPEAFEHVLRFIYTGRVGGPLPGPLARPVAELADRLLLLELCREAQARVLSEISAESVVDCLLWAGAQDGGSFSQLLADLKAWYVEHVDDVLARAKPSLMRLMSENPGLMVELQELLAAGRSHKRPRLQC